jgi:release factor glutamine methyltransferase
MIVKEVLDKTTQFFKDKRIDTARLDSELLISSALGLRRIELYLKFEQPLKESEVEICRDFVRRRSQGEPVAYILGRRDFYGLQFKTDSRVLIPRPETELLVERALQEMKNRKQECWQVLDLGCGSGCIGLSIANFEKSARVVLVDSSEGAAEVAKHNRQSLGLEGSTEVIVGDAMTISLETLRWDFVLANPPYISEDDPEVQDSVKRFEPSQALFSNNEGLADIFNWSLRYAPKLQPGGFMIFEIGYQQGPKVKEHFESLSVFDRIEIMKDLSGLDRFICAQKRGIQNG